MRGERAMTRWLRRTRPQLRLVFLLSGSALALSFAAVDIVAGAALVFRTRTPLGVALLVLLALGPPTLAGLVPPLRQVEATAAVSLLSVDIGGDPASAQTWDQRRRTVVWFWLHLISGAVAATALVFGGVFAVMLVVKPFTARPGEPVMGDGGLTVTGTGRDVLLVAAGPVLLLAVLALVVGCGAVMARLAPWLLGPTPAEKFAALDARAATLVERTRLARELHDSVGHALSVVVLQSAAARRRLESDPAAAAQSLAASEAAARTALEDLDGVLGLLREDDGAAQRQPIRDLTALDELVRATRTAGHDIRLVAAPAEPGRIPGVVSREAYRIIQEGLTNALRHAPGQPIAVELGDVKGMLQITVTNPTVRASSWFRSGRGGRGLAGVAERVKILGGTMAAAAHDGTWQLQVGLPLPLPAAQPTVHPSANELNRRRSTHDRDDGAEAVHPGAAR